MSLNHRCGCIFITLHCGRSHRNAEPDPARSSLGPLGTITTAVAGAGPQPNCRSGCSTRLLPARAAEMIVAVAFLPQAAALWVTAAGREAQRRRARHCTSRAKAPISQRLFHRPPTETISVRPVLGMSPQEPASFSNPRKHAMSTIRHVPLIIVVLALDSTRTTSCGRARDADRPRVGKRHGPSRP